MSETTDLETLLAIMPPVTASDTRPDWDQMTAIWDRQFPATYRRFMEVYGAGSIEDYLQITDPPPADQLASVTETAVDLWRDAPKAPDLANTTPKLIAWGADSSGDHLCWDASNRDPEQWPVLAYSRGPDEWRRYDCGMAGFLVRVLQATFPKNPLGDVALWGRQTATYLTNKEYDRRLDTGIDPFTGEPDPFAETSSS